MATTPTASTRRKHVHVRGIVQGVGFRPFVYNLARSLGLIGYVFNSSSGVTIEIEGSETEINSFLDTLRSDPPHLAAIAGIEISDVATRGGGGFSILESHEEQGGFSLISPDAGTCDACWRDFGDPHNRRFGYPFTNCTHCGPRYTIIRDIPYDRATTTMAGFTMCPACAAEYADPGDRRFHAQPNACAACGPSLALVAAGTAVADCSFADRDSLAIIRKARALLRAGNILAVKGLGGFLLACDAGNDAAVAELRRRKRRSDKPFALMARDLPSIEAICEVSRPDATALFSVRRPIVVLPRAVHASVSAEVAPGNDTLGVMLPYTPLHYLLFSDSPDVPSEFPALVMTSGNLSEEPIVVANAEALRRLTASRTGSSCTIAISRPAWTIPLSASSRVASACCGARAGLFPKPIDLGIELHEVLAFGGELKNTFCLTKGRYAILSQHIGDLENFETMQFFEETLARLQTHLPRLAARCCLRSAPRLSEHPLRARHPASSEDRRAASSRAHRQLHGGEPSSRRGDRRRLRRHRLRHRRQNLGRRISGRRFCRLRPAARTFVTCRCPAETPPFVSPGAMGLSYLRDAFSQQIPDALTCFPGVKEKQVQLVTAMLTKGIQTVETSSCGRLFDAVAAILGISSEVTFKGQAAIALETAAARATGGSQSQPQEYPFDIEGADPLILDLRATIRALAGEATQGCPVEEISARFHNTLAAAIVEVCARIRQRDGLDRVCLSGGTFQNLYLLERTIVELRRRNFAVFLHAQVPANDGGIALGQAVIASELLRRSGS